MTRVTGPLFGTRATGQIGDLGHFRQGRHGAEFVTPQNRSGRKVMRLSAFHACFATAKAAHSALPTTRVKIAGVWHEYRVPSWTDFWRQWLVNHPECHP